MMAMAVTSAFSVIVTSQKSPVGEAPPLTPLAGEPHGNEPSPAAAGPEPEAPKPPPVPVTVAGRKWTTREIKIGDAHPLDLVFSKDGAGLYVSADDATLREYTVASGEAVHKASVPAKGDRIALLFGRYLAVIRPEARVARVPILDTTHWDYDPILLEVGAGPGEVIEMPDGTVVVGTTIAHRVARFALPSGKLVADIRLPQATGQAFLVRSGGRPMLAALGSLTHAGRPAGAWLDLFDPAEAPFGATRRSVAVGRDPRAGAVTSDGGRLFFPDFASNTALLVDVRNQTGIRQAEVGQGPIASFVLAGDRHGVTLNASSGSATVVDFSGDKSAALATTTLSLAGEPRDGALSPDRSTLFVALGGGDAAPRGQGVAVIGGDPPGVVATLPTGMGAISVAVSPDGTRAAVANYFSKTITILE
jgi:DNA-binding beta-propeller fold protein YncE